MINIRKLHGGIIQAEHKTNTKSHVLSHPALTILILEDLVELLDKLHGELFLS